MRYSKSIKHHVAMGNYEWIEFGAEIEVDDDKFDFQELSERVENMLAEDIKEARLNTDEKKSYIHLYKKEN